MMKSVAKFLTDKPEPDYRFLARLFVTEFFKEPKRGYGQNIVEVFHKLRNSKFEDVYKPAKEQFMGESVKKLTLWNIPGVVIDLVHTPVAYYSYLVINCF